MGQHEVILFGLLAAPVLLLMVLRVNATMVFLSLCLGYVLMQFLGSDAQSFAQTFMANAALSTNVMKLGLLLFPSILTMLFMIGTARGARLFFNVLPSLAVGCLSVLLIVPLLPPGTSHAVTSMGLWHQALRLQSLLVGGGALVSLLFLWTQRPPRRLEDHTKRH